MKKESKTTIITLGAFDVQINGASILFNTASSKKIWTLYKFMLTHRHNFFTPEALVEKLWEGKEYDNPRGTLRRQMFRLREILGESSVDEGMATVLYNNGLYKWNDTKDIEIDVELFESWVKKGDDYIDMDKDAALDAYEMALNLYEDNYMSECVEEHWALTERNKYRRMFLRVMSMTIELYNEKGAYSQVIDLCQKAVRIDIYEESYHLSLLGALIVNGETRAAVEHYKYITGFYARELGLKASPNMKSMYIRILQSQNTITSQGDLKSLLKDDPQNEKAFYCEPDVFKSIYELEQRRVERTGMSYGLCVLTLKKIKGEAYTKTEAKLISLKQYLMVKLRKGDTICRWNDYQLLLLLPGIHSEALESVVRRLIKNQEAYASVGVTSITYLPES